MPSKYRLETQGESAGVALDSKDLSTRQADSFHLHVMAQDPDTSAPLKRDATHFNPGFQQEVNDSRS